MRLGDKLITAHIHALFERAYEETVINITMPFDTKSLDKGRMGPRYQDHYEDETSDSTDN